jgi:hypothetical protein
LRAGRMIVNPVASAYLVMTVRRQSPTRSKSERRTLATLFWSEHAPVGRPLYDTFHMTVRLLRRWRGAEELLPRSDAATAESVPRSASSNLAAPSPPRKCLPAMAGCESPNWIGLGLHRFGRAHSRTPFSPIPRVFALPVLPILEFTAALLRLGSSVTMAPLRPLGLGAD